MKICVTGHKGKIGSELLKLGCIPLDCDVTDTESIKSAKAKTDADLVIHCAGVADVDACELDYEKAINVNYRGTVNLLEVFGDRIVYISSEQVFNGEKGNYSEGDDPSPVNNYAFTKLGAEGVVGFYGGKIVRLSRSVSYSVTNYNTDIVRYMNDIVRGLPITVPNYMYRSYLHVEHAAEAIVNFANRFEEMPKLLHVGSLEVLNFYQFMCMVKDSKFGNSDGISQTAKLNEKSKTPRPMKCGLDVSLARRMNIPLYSSYDAAKLLWRDYESTHRHTV